MSYIIKPIPTDHEMRWRAAYCVVDTEKEGVLHKDLGFTMAWVDSIAEGERRIADLEIQDAHKIMVQGTKAEGL